MRFSNLALVFIALLLLSPYLILVGFFVSSSSAQIELNQNFTHVFQFTVLQATLSTCFALVFGILGAFGLISVRTKLGSRYSGLLDLVALFPNSIPVLFVILAAMNLAPSLSGLWGIVVLHAGVNVGLVAIAFESILIHQAGAYLELAYVEGATRFRMIFRILVPLLWREIAALALTVFSLCFSSFAIPLMIGGSQATTLEVLIYELIRIDLNWTQALLISVLQLSVILVLSFAIRSRAAIRSQRVVSLKFFGVTPLALFALLPSILFASGLFAGVLLGLEQLVSELRPAFLVDLFANSFFVSLLTALLSLVVLAVLAFIQPSGVLRKVLLGIIAPSSILSGFALLLIWRATGFATLLKISIGLSLIFVPILYRLRWDAMIEQLRGQMQTARVLGASTKLVFFKIIWPQAAPTAAKLAGIASFWAWGDFALSKVVAEKTVTVSLLIQSLMSSYRLNSATALLWVMLVASGLTYFLVWSLVNVSGRKSTH